MSSSENVPVQTVLDPTERATFIERTGVILRWILIVTCSVVQFLSPVVPFTVYWIALPVAVLYNAGLQVLIKRRNEHVLTISVVSGVGDILVSAVLIFFAERTDIYLWYFVLLVSHAARYGFAGAIASPVVFSALYAAGLYARGLQFAPEVMLVRSLFFVITGVVSGYLAREEHRRFDRILRQQRELFETQQKRKELRDTLQRYVSFNVVEQLISHPDELKLGGSRRKVSVLFSDIQGFTSLLAAKEPEQIIQQLNEYLTEMTDLIFSFGGMVDKFVGDAIIGIFGALGEQPDDTRRAVRCAIAMQKKLCGLQAKWRAEGAPVFNSRIAVNTGEVIMGNVGSPQRMDFTAIGEPVNVASRLQAVANVGAVVICTACYEEMKDFLDVRNQGTITLRGMTEPVNVYEVVGEKTCPEA
jgi:class 3 adenylate cyclase